MIHRRAASTENRDADQPPDRIALASRATHGGGTTRNPAVSPGATRFDRLSTKTVRSGISAASGSVSGRRKV